MLNIATQGTLATYTLETSLTCLPICIMSAFKKFSVSINIAVLYINKQIAQKYRNSRKRTSTANCPKLKLALQSESINETPDPLSSVEEDKENIEALQKLMASRNPPAQTVQELLTATHIYTLKKPEISIHEILHKFPVLKEPKWVSFVVHANYYCIFF